MQVQVRINEEGALRNQRFAFTDKFTLISELMQNARRAGAQRIEITYDETSGMLRVVDDGCGITDFQKLLTFNESGWDKDTCDEERPFGIGFSKCLYSASRCIVSSRNRKIDFLTEEAIARKPIDVVEIEHHPHTVIELHDVRLPSLAERLPHMCSGFPVAIWFNGRALPRMHAVGHRPFLPADIGLVYLAGTGNGRHTFHTLVFLQGFCVLRPVYFDNDHVNVVHLNSKQFLARLPDRDKLIDEEDQKKRIDASLKSLWRQVLLDAKTRMAAESFVDIYFEAMRGWGHLDLLNDVPLLPRRVCERIVSYPIQPGYEDCAYLAPIDHSVSRREVEDGGVVLVSLDDVNGDNAACWMVAKAKDYLVLSPASLHHDHWVHPYVRSLDEEAVHVDAVGEQCRVTLEGRWIWPLVVLCDAVVITVGDEFVTVSEEGVYHDDTLFIPAGEWSGEPVRQASDFIDTNDQYLEGHCDEDRHALADLIRRLRSGDPRATLDSLLQELKLEKYPLLHGKVFQVTVGHDRGEHAVEVLQAPATHSPSAEGRS
jgi:hypothetical protein